MPRSKAIDPAQLKHRVKFLKETKVSDGYAGHRLDLVPDLETWCEIEPAGATLSYNDLLQTVAGSTQVQRDIAIKIRHRQGFMPVKDMQFEVKGQRYTITNPAQEIGDPVRYIRVVGKFSK